MRPAIGASVLCWLLAIAGIGHAELPQAFGTNAQIFSGYGPSSAQREREIETILRLAPSAESFSKHLLYLTEEPHQTGTPRNIDLETAANAWRAALAWLRESADESEAEGSAIESLDRTAAEWLDAAAILNAARGELLRDANRSSTSTARWREWNRKLRQVERSFYAPNGLPGSEWSRNLFSALRFESDESTLPGLRWAIEDRDDELFDAQTSTYANALKQARDLTRELAAELRAPTAKDATP